MSMHSAASAELFDANRRLSQATAALICNHPFFATLLLRLVRVPDPSAETMWTDGTHLGYNPAFVTGLPRDHLVGVLGHEVIHVASLHPWRQGNRDNRAWNVACDKVANAIIEEAGLALPPNAIPGVPGKAAEELYEPPPKSDSGRRPGQTAGRPGQESSGGAEPSQNDPSSEPVDPGGTGEVRAPRHPDGTPLSAAEREQQMQELRIAIQQAVNAAKRAGALPAGLARFAAETLEPKVPWREILARFLDTYARHDYNWARPNRRYIQAGFMLPSLWSQAYGKVVMGCDTSGSVSKEQLTRICSEILGALETYAERGDTPELTLAWFDQKVYPQTVEDAKDLNPIGGGGTSFRVVFEWLEALPEPPTAVVMVTDGHCADFGTEPAVPVLWILTESHPKFRPPFGEIAFTIND
jgi:predicted metal-dependent peptidase